MSGKPVVDMSDPTYSWTEPLEEAAGAGEAKLHFHVTKRSGVPKDLEIKIFGRYQVRKDAQPREIAKLEAYLISGYQPGTDFHRYMASVDKATEECKGLATTLFQKSGKIHGIWVSDPLFNGAGRWSFKDLEQAIFVVVDCCGVEAGYRNKGVGKGIVKALIAWADHNGAKTVFLRTFAHDDDDISGLPYQPIDPVRAITFWRSLGFRRIGTSDYFCYSSDAGSPAWPAGEDWNPPGFGEVIEDDVAEDDGTEDAENFGATLSN